MQLLKQNALFISKIGIKCNAIGFEESRSHLYAKYCCAK